MVRTRDYRKSEGVHSVTPGSGLFSSFLKMIYMKRANDRLHSATPELLTPEFFPMYLPLGTFSPEIKLGLVSASRNCFPRALSDERTTRLLTACQAAGINPIVPQGDCRIIETKDHAAEAARQL